MDMEWGYLRIVLLLRRVLLALPLDAVSVAMDAKSSGASRLAVGVSKEYAPPGVSPDAPLLLEFAEGWRCAAARQLASLAGHGLQLVRELQRKKLCASGIAYHLTDAGRTRAMELRSGGEAKDAAPLHHHQRVKPNEKGAVILLVDEREGGGRGEGSHVKREGRDALRRRCGGGPDTWPRS